MTDFISSKEGLEKTLTKLSQDAANGDKMAAQAIHAIAFADRLAGSLIAACKQQVRVDQPPIAAVPAFAGAFGSALYELEINIIPGVLDEVRHLLDLMDTDPVVVAERKASREKLEGVQKLVNDALASGRSREEVKLMAAAAMEDPTPSRQ